jgi:hypothetical protein
VSEKHRRSQTRTIFFLSSESLLYFMSLSCLLSFSLPEFYRTDYYAMFLVAIIDENCSAIALVNNRNDLIRVQIRLRSCSSHFYRIINLMYVQPIKVYVSMLCRHLLFTIILLKHVNCSNISRLYRNYRLNHGFIIPNG